MAEKSSVSLRVATAIATILLISVMSAIARENEQAVLKMWVDSLTSDGFAGRDVPGPGGERAADYIYNWLEAGEFEGFEVSRQEVPLQQSTLVTGNCVMALSNPRDMLMARWGEQFFVFPRKAVPVEMFGDGLFCGYGVTVPEENRNDYPVEVKGKVAIVKAGTDLPAGKAGMRGNAAFKAAAAERAGATALVVVYTDPVWPPAELAEKIAAAKNPIIDLPNSSAEFLITYIHVPGWSDSSLATLTRCNFRIPFSQPVSVPSENIVASKRGVQDEWIVVGAHYDHIGEGFPGADDNTSGVAGLLCLTERFAFRNNLQRGIIFVWFTAEEDGLLGSSWFARNLPVAREKIVAMVNLDMIGRDGFGSMREASVPGKTPQPGYAGAIFSGGSPSLRDLIRAASDQTDLSVNIHPVNSFRYFGDASPFHSEQIPTMHIFGGFHADYHTKTDTPDKINFPKMEKMIDLIDKILINLIEVPDRPSFDPTIKVEGGGMGY